MSDSVGEEAKKDAADEVFNLDPVDLREKTAGEELDSDFNDTIKHFSFSVKKGDQSNASILNPNFGVLHGINRHSSIKDSSG